MSTLFQHRQCWPGHLRQGRHLASIEDERLPRLVRLTQDLTLHAERVEQSGQQQNQARPGARSFRRCVSPISKNEQPRALIAEWDERLRQAAVSQLLSRSRKEQAQELSWPGERSKPGSTCPPILRAHRHSETGEPWYARYRAGMDGWETSELKRSAFLDRLPSPHPSQTCGRAKRLRLRYLHVRRRTHTTLPGLLRSFMVEILTSYSPEIYPRQPFLNQNRNHFILQKK
jgi:hypothetical protein